MSKSRRNFLGLFSQRFSKSSRSCYLSQKILSKEPQRRRSSRSKDKVSYSADGHSPFAPELLQNRL